MKNLTLLLFPENVYSKLFLGRLLQNRNRPLQILTEKSKWKCQLDMAVFL